MDSKLNLFNSKSLLRYTISGEISGGYEFEPYIKKVTEYVRNYLPDLDHNKPAILETCMYTMSPDGYPIIDRVAENLVVGCGFSGSGFKHSPATGKMLAALALGQEKTIPAGFRSDRYVLDRLELSE